MLTPAQRASFERDGWLHVKGAIDAECIAAVRRELAEAVDEAAEQLRQRGMVEELHEELDFAHRLAALYEQATPIRQMVSRSVQFPRPWGSSDGAVGRPTAGKAFFELLTHPPLLELVSSLLGSTEIVANGNQRLRPKLPAKEDIFVIPWHQDQCFLHPDSDPTDELPPVITAWVPFVDAGPDSGCLEMLRLPEDQGLLHHYIANISHPTNREVESSAQSTSIHPDHLPHGCAPVAVPAAAGDVILLSSLTPHRSTANTSGAVRWAADIRYQVPEAGNCFPQEASFLAASEQRPDDVVTDWQEYVKGRNQHVVEKIRSGSSIERGTERNWRPARGEVFKDAAARHPLEGEMEYVGRLRVIADEEYGAEKVDSRERFARL